MRSRVAVRPSGIEGLGIFALGPAREGEVIAAVPVVREVSAEAPIREDRGERRDHCSYPDGKVLLIGYPTRHVNHSCDPNAWERFGDGTSSALVARRAIAAGDEITIDYAINASGGDSWPCRCGAARCRGTVEGEFFNLSPALQREYRPLLAEWFVRRHAARLAVVGL